MRRTLTTCLTVLAFTASIGSFLPATANHCNNPVNLGSGWFATEEEEVVTGMGTAGPTLHQWPACTGDSAGQHAAVDGRVIWPGASHVQPSYNADILGAPETIEATLNGMGFTDKIVTLKRNVLEATGGVFYLGGWYKIPNGAATTGAITVRANLANQTFRTLA